ncbi:MAG: FAD-dependent thymidylate synthase [Eggerthellaceae bacterium]|nr:FAD-dependent thymidylate synthase [Eggerthellaceae bacterium]
MKVSVISATENPVEVISRAAGTCYGKDNASRKRMEACYNSGHLSVFEHATVSFRIEGISRACMAQLTRHRHVSFCVESQRYNRYDLNGVDWYVAPPSFMKCTAGLKFFDHYMKEAADAYIEALADGEKPEDARYLLPEATKTNLVMTCNVRELFHILDMRMDKAAQWEIRGLAKAMHEACKGINKEWCEVMELRA